ncbi:MAG: NAD(P)H-binding protein, partial [Ligilactobacillus acidipiscis]|jgi:putative NADH-flavin reductase|nr:NAD(P)H-binding protein [Ligilactobacillus acidipiscis]
LRHPDKLSNEQAGRGTLIQGDVLDKQKLLSALEGQNIVYANLAGADIEQQAKEIVAGMDKKDVKRLIWISSIGIYNEVPGKFGEWNNKMLGESYLPTYAAAAKTIEQSDLDYTILRPAWLSNKDEVSYEFTQKGETFNGTEVSRKSVGKVVANLVQNPTEHLHESLGINKPNTGGEKPEWY